MIKTKNKAPLIRENDFNTLATVIGVLKAEGFGVYATNSCLERINYRDIDLVVYDPSKVHTAKKIINIYNINLNGGKKRIIDYEESSRDKFMRLINDFKSSAKDVEVKKLRTSTNKNYNFRTHCASIETARAKIRINGTLIDMTYTPIPFGINNNVKRFKF